jgi:ribosomal protein S18 acetylase RimI-like enzyme
MSEAVISIRALRSSDEAILNKILYQSIFVPEGSEPPNRDVVKTPELRKYTQSFGRTGDVGYVAFDNSELAGAAWLRLHPGENKGYGYVNDETPELTVAVMQEYRGRGLGTALLKRLFEEARARYQAISLSVWRENPASHLFINGLVLKR